MRALTPLFALAVVLLCLAPVGPTWATDQDGGDDCLKEVIEDWGDAPEGVQAYPGVIGRFPTCRTMDLVGTQELVPGCGFRSTPPHVTGHIFHRQGPSVNGGSYWLGCYPDPLQGVLGIDREGEGKVNEPAQGSSFCPGDLPTDCVEAAFGLTWDQDECYADGSDAGLTRCQPAAITFNTYSCRPAAHEVFLNILVDMNHDGDWNDVEDCGPTGCAYEWAVKNEIIVVPPGCAVLTSPAFPVGATPGPAWMRISLTDDRVTDDYPWAGGAGHSGFFGGETEDYPAMIEQEVPALPSSWGEVKARYR